MILEFEETHQAVVTLDLFAGNMVVIKIKADPDTKYISGVKSFYSDMLGSQWTAAKWLWDQLYGSVPEDEDENSDIQYLYEILSDAMEKAGWNY